MPEKILWQRLKGAATHRFRRQEVIGPYIVDFVSLSARMVVELDGRSHHDDAQGDRDIVRQIYLESLGFLVLRYSNDEVLRDPDGTARSIWDTALTRISGN